MAIFVSGFQSQVTKQPSLPISALPMTQLVFHALGMIPAWKDHGFFVVPVFARL
jgi:hypothetical protein